MPKRKRGVPSVQDGQELENSIKGQKIRFGKKLAHGKKRVVHALKIAKRFERQKLGKRIVRRKGESNGDRLGRLERELEALKLLDVSLTAEAHLHKNLARTKDLTTHPAVRDHLSKATLTPAASDDIIVLAQKTVLARLYNYRHVKLGLLSILNGLRNVLGIKDLEDGPKEPSGLGVSLNRAEAALINQRVDEASEATKRLRTTREGSDNTSEWASHVTQIETPEPQAINARPVPSHEPRARKPPLPSSMALMEEHTNSRRSPAINVEDSDHSSADTSEPSFEPASPLPSRLAHTRGTTKPLVAPNSTFLPSLTLGGYWSGSESAEDMDEPQLRKNRAGQRARRQLWEKKFGRTANHLKHEARHDGWNSRRGARSHERPDGQKEREGSQTGPLRRTSNHTNDAPAAPASRRELPLHPSWEAARKAKEQKQATAFAGKKIVFE